MYVLHKRDMNGVFPIFMFYSARILEEYKSLNVLNSLNTLKVCNSVLNFAFCGVMGF